MTTAPVDINANLWNIPTNADASVVWDYNSSTGLTVTVDFSNVTEITPSDVVAGYPSLSYGQTFYGGQNTSNPNVLSLPILVSSLVTQPMWLSDTYSISNSKNIPFDFSYDIFLTPQPATSTSLGPSSLGGGLELMIWTDWHGIGPSSYTGQPVASYYLETSINGQMVNEEWNVYEGPGGSGTPCVTFELANPMSSGSVSVNLSQVLADLGNTAIANADGISASELNSLYLDNIQLGSEFGDPGKGTYSYSWTLQDFSINGDPVVTSGSSGDQMILEGNSSNYNGAITAGTGGVIELDNANIYGSGGSVTTTSGGIIESTGAGAVNTISGVTVSNAGTIEAIDGSTLIIEVGVSNSGVLIANAADLIIEGAVTGKGTATITDGGLLEFGAASATGVTFSGASAGTLVLEAPSSFTGAVSGFAANDFIDLTDVNYSKASLTYKANSADTGGTLTVTDGTHTAHITLVGIYTAASFTHGNDGGGGTLIG